jgi:hypothetical protein
MVEKFTLKPIEFNGYVRATIQIGEDLVRVSDCERRAHLTPVI